MKSIILAICCFVVMIWTAQPCPAHGVDGVVERDEGYCVTAVYDDGDPMSYAALEIKAPNSEIGFQTGRTDRNGRFVFRPDTPGRWQAIVRDGMGHRLTLDVEVDDGVGASEKVHTGVGAPGAATNRMGGVLIGLAFIFGLCGFFYGWRARSGRAGGEQGCKV